MNQLQHSFFISLHFL